MRNEYTLTKIESNLILLPDLTFYEHNLTNEVMALFTKIVIHIYYGFIYIALKFIQM